MIPYYYILRLLLLGSLLGGSLLGSRLLGRSLGLHRSLSLCGSSLLGRGLLCRSLLGGSGFLGLLSLALILLQTCTQNAYFVLLDGEFVTEVGNLGVEAIFSSIFSIQYSRLFFNRIFRFSQSSRASFKTWANDAASYKHSEFRDATLESCLDHRHEKYANAYDREQALGDMRRVFDAWGEFCFSKLTEEQKKRLGL